MSNHHIHRDNGASGERDADHPSISRRTENLDSEDVIIDPLLDALAAAEWDDEPLTDRERVAIREGREAYLRGESTPWKDVRRSLLNEADAVKTLTS